MREMLEILIAFGISFMSEFFFFFTSLPVYLLCSHHLLATVYESKGEFRTALIHEKEAYSIYNNQVCFKILKYHVCWRYIYAIGSAEKVLCFILEGW